MTRVLVIEDDEWLRQSYRRELEAAEHEITEVGDALAAIDALDGESFEVIILDLWLPGPNGIALLNELQSHHDLALIPVILCTTQTVNVDAKDLAAYGVRRVFDKSMMKPGDLAAAVREVAAYE